MNLDFVRARARALAEKLYDGRCTVYEFTDTVDAETFITTSEETAVYEDLPCRLSFDRSPSAGKTDTADNISQGITLFLAPDIEIKAGSRIEVTQSGVTEIYRSSGVPRVYKTHQEIKLELKREYA